MSTFRLCWIIIALLLFQHAYCQEEDATDATNTDTETPNADEYNMSEDMENAFGLLNKMYNAITHGDARYFNMIIKQFQNDSITPLIADESIMEAIESNFVHVLNTMHLVSEISIKIKASPMQIKNMNDGLFLILKSMISYLKKSQLNGFISDKIYEASFVNLLFCEGISLSLQFRLIQSLKYLLIPTVMNNTEQYYCFNTYHNIVNQSLFHIATKSRASGFVRLFFHLPTSLPVMKTLHLNNKALLKKINKNNPIINQQMIKKRVSDIDVLIILKTAFKLNMPNEWYLRTDINGKTALDLWIKRSPYYLKYVYYHSVISKLFLTNFMDLNMDNNSCISMPYITRYWPIIQWFPLPKTDTVPTEIAEVNGQSEFDAIFEQKWFEQKPVIFRKGVFDKWNLSNLELGELSNIFAEDVFKYSDIPYQDIYEQNENYLENDDEENVVGFDEFAELFFSKLQSANLEVMCKELRENYKKKQEQSIDISYIFDNSVYWKNAQFIERFNVRDLIPTYIYTLMQRMIDDYNEQNMHLSEEEKIVFELDEVVDSIVMLKQTAIGGMFSGAQPHFHGPVFNALLKGQKQWIVFPPKKAFQMKQTAVQFFCYHKGLSQEKKEKLTYYTFTQNVGDVVFIPHEWTHAVLNIEPSIAVAVELFV